MKPKSTFKTRPDLYAEFEAVPTTFSLRWTTETDAVLIKYWGNKNKSAFTEVFSNKFFKVSRSALDERYNKLVSGKTVTKPA